MTDTELKAEIKRGVSGGYLLYGGEEYMKSHYAAAIRSAALAGRDISLDAFNNIEVKSTKFDLGALEDAVTSMPVMADRKVVTYYPCFAAMRERDRDSLVAFLARLGDYTYTVLIMMTTPDDFNAGYPPKKPSAIFKKLTAYLKPAEFAVQPAAKLRKWLAGHFAADSLFAPPDVCDAMLERCGSDMFRLSGECEKLTMYAKAHGMTELDRDTVMLVCSEAEDEDSFRLSNAVLAGDRAAALRAFLEMKQRRDEPVMIIAAVSRVVREMLYTAVYMSGGRDKRDIAKSLGLHEYKAGLYMRAVAGITPSRLAGAAERCRRAESLVKGSGLGYEAIERFLCTLPRARG